MNSSGDAAEQIVRMSLEGVEVAAKITGAGAKEMTAILYSILKNKDKNKIKGKSRLTSMLKSGKELKVFTVSEKNLKTFSKEAKRYGIVYCALRNKKASHDGLVDVMVRAEDASKINRIVERFKFSTVDTATIKSKIEKTQDGKSNPEKVNDDALVSDLMGKAPDNGKPVPEKEVPGKTNDDKLLDELMAKPVQKESSLPQNPNLAKTEKSPPSEPTSRKQSKTAEGTTKSAKPSVRKELKAIKAEQEKKADTSKGNGKEVFGKSTPAKSAEHKQPQIRKKNKSNKSKGR